MCLPTIFNLTYSFLLSTLEDLFHLFNDGDPFLSFLVLDPFVICVRTAFLFLMMLENFFMNFNQVAQLFLSFFLGLLLLLLDFLELRDQIFSLLLNPFSDHRLFLMVLLLQLLLLQFAFLGSRRFRVFSFLVFHEFVCPFVKVTVVGRVQIKWLVILRQCGKPIQVRVGCWPVFVWPV